jgi:hypothetical protein
VTGSTTSCIETAKHLTERRRRRRKQLLNDLKEKQGYWNWKEEAYITVFREVDLGGLQNFRTTVYVMIMMIIVMMTWLFKTVDLSCYRLSYFVFYFSLTSYVMNSTRVCSINRFLRKYSKLETSCMVTRSNSKSGRNEIKHLRILSKCWRKSLIRNLK